jgi:3-keto-5-aminohexanoate cleavage enzyme
MEKLIITVAPTGNVPTRQTNPHLPLTPDEIAADVFRCYQAGAAVVHLHARNEAGQPTADPEVFRQIVEKVRQKCDIIIQLSTGARAGKNAEERGACIELAPEMASLTTGSTNFSNSVNFNPPDMIMDLVRMMNQHGVKPEIEVFDLSALEYAGYLVKKKILKEPLHINLVLGVPGSMGGSARNLFFPG